MSREGNLDKVIVLGDSPFLKEIEHLLHYVVDKYYTIGINGVIKRCRADLHAFTDLKLIKLTNSYPNVPVLTLKGYGDLIRKSNQTLIDTFTYNDDYIWKKGDKLAWCGFTHDYVISYLIGQKVKEIVLLGAADFINGKHYSNEYDFKRSKVLEDKSKQFIKNCNDTYISIKTCNPNSDIEGIEYVPIEELLEC